MDTVAVRMAASLADEPQQRWIRGLLQSSLLRSPPLIIEQRQAEVMAYVELFSQLSTDTFVNGITELIRMHYPQEQPTLLDDVLASFVLHWPERGHAILHALLSSLVHGTLPYARGQPPFHAFVALFSPTAESRALQPASVEQYELACGEILRMLTHYNRPVRRPGGFGASITVGSQKGPRVEGPDHGRDKGFGVEGLRTRSPERVLTCWITDCVLAAPEGFRRDYFRWCGGVMGQYAASGELRPLSAPLVGGGPGKHPQLLPSTPRWAVANGAAVILSVCDDEVERYASAELTAAAVPALLLPPPATEVDEHLIQGLPPLEPYARLFHRYYACATPGATQRLLLGLLEAPPSWAPDALDAAVQLVELMRSAEDYSSSCQLPPNWLHLHFLRPIGAAMAKQAGVASDAAAALLFRIFSQPALLFPPPGHAQGMPAVNQWGQAIMPPDAMEKAQAAAARANEDATARSVVALMVGHGPEVEWRICALWEAAYGLLPRHPSSAALPSLVMSVPLVPPVLSWNILRPLLRVFEHLPPGSPSQASLRRIFSATVEAILERTFQSDETGRQRGDHLDGSLRGSQAGGGGAGARSVGMAELRAMVHHLFMEACPSPTLASQLLANLLTACLAYDAARAKEGKAVEEKLLDGSQGGERAAAEGMDRGGGVDGRGEGEGNGERGKRGKGGFEGGKDMGGIKGSVLGNEISRLRGGDAGCGSAGALRDQSGLRESEKDELLDPGVKGGVGPARAAGSEPGLGEVGMEGVSGSEAGLEEKRTAAGDANAAVGGLGEGGSRRTKSGPGRVTGGKQRSHRGSQGKRAASTKPGKERGAVATLDSYVIAALCALACEVQLASLSPTFFSASRPGGTGQAGPKVERERAEDGEDQGRGAGGGAGGGGRRGGGWLRSESGEATPSQGVDGGHTARWTPARGGQGGGLVPRRSLMAAGQLSPAQAMRGGSVDAGGDESGRVLRLLETVLALIPASMAAVQGSNGGPSEVVAAAVVAAHVSRLLATSRASMHALTAIMRCSAHLRDRAASVMSLVEENSRLAEAAQSAAAAAVAPVAEGPSGAAQDGDEKGEPSPSGEGKRAAEAAVMEEREDRDGRDQEPGSGAGLEAKPDAMEEGETRLCGTSDGKRSLGTMFGEGGEADTDTAGRFGIRPGLEAGSEGDRCDGDSALNVTEEGERLAHKKVNRGVEMGDGNFRPMTAQLEKDKKVLVLPRGRSPTAVCEGPPSRSGSPEEPSPSCSDLVRQCERGSSSRSRSGSPVNLGSIMVLDSGDGAAEHAAVQPGVRTKGTTEVMLMSLLTSQQELALAAVPLLWQRLVSSPEVPVNQEGTSARRGWRQVAEALCNLVVAFPGKAAAAIVAQAEADLLPWTSEADADASGGGPRGGGRQLAVPAWSLNARIVSLVAEILQLKQARSWAAVTPVAGARALLRRATEGMARDGEEGMLPQLELLEAAAMAARSANTWPVNGRQVADNLLELLRERLPSVVRCLSHKSAHVRALAASLLHTVLYSALSETAQQGCEHACSSVEHRVVNPPMHCHLASNEWQRAVEQCVLSEVDYRMKGGLSTALLVDAASALGCLLPAS